MLISREPMYGVGPWARRYALDLLDLFHHEVKLLNDDRVGHDLGRSPNRPHDGVVIILS